jgi:NhaP-type Na+/H+ or K+/H+ antiporter
VGDLAGLTISVVALSILIHGITAPPLLARYERALPKSEKTRQDQSETRKYRSSR